MTKTSLKDIKPVFIHSLFRSGSTYLFKAFRRSPDGYWCYQEPLNEALLNVATNPSLLDEPPEATSKKLDHPSLDKPYFWEFHVVQDELHDLLHKKMIYDSFFSGDTELISMLSCYIGALIEKAQGRPVLQFCRSFGRLRHMPKIEEAVHLLLWREPRNQWWSYKVHPYFDLANLLILNAEPQPNFITAVRHIINFEEFHDVSIEREIGHFWGKLPDAQTSYLIFYALWCYSIIECMPFIDLQINITSLARSSEYRSRTIATLKAMGVGGLDLSDCRLDQAYNSLKEDALFSVIEDKVHNILSEAGLANKPEEVIKFKNEQVVYNQKHCIDIDNSIVSAETNLYNTRERLHNLGREFGVATSSLYNMQEQNLFITDSYGRLKERIEAIEKSFYWRIMTPLRFLWHIWCKLLNRNVI